MNKKLAHNWYWIVGGLIALLLVLHYSGALNQKRQTSNPDINIQNIDLEQIQNDAQADLEQALEFEQVATTTPEFDTTGFETTESGLMYKAITDAPGEEKPNANSRVLVHYVGTLVDGSEFDSSRSRGEPIDFALNGVIRGWTEGLQLMSVGDLYEFIIPVDLAYGQAGHPLSGQVLKFEVELLDIIE